MGSFKATMPCNTPKWLCDSPTWSELEQISLDKIASDQAWLKQQWETNTFPLTLEEYAIKLENDIVTLNTNHAAALLTRHHQVEVLRKRCLDWNLKYDNVVKEHNAFVKKITRQKATLARRINRLLESDE